jgi:predicted nucleic-acid-binding protein
MIGLDTNILVRIIAHDDAEQEALAAHLVSTLSAGNRGHISLIVVSELAWVLERTYRLGREIIIEGLRRLLHSADITVERADLVEWALAEYLREKADLADILIAEMNREAGCTTTYTFDKFAARIGGLTLLDAGSPS